MNISDAIKKKWLNDIESVTKILFTLSPYNNWTNTQKIKNTYRQTIKSLDQDLKELELNGKFLFFTPSEIDNATIQNLSFIRKWHKWRSNTSALAICIFAATHLNITIKDDLKKALIIAAILCDIPNDLSYHNTWHYKKVLLQIIRLISAHNMLNQNTDQHYSDDNVTTLMITACIHDLGHDGQGNTLDEKYHQARLERQSYQTAIKYFYAIGFENKDQFESLMDHIRTMLLCTDVSPLGSRHSFTNQMKSIYRKHFRSETLPIGFKLDPELYLLKKDEKLTSMALLLHEADMASSSSLGYDLTVFETASFYKEIGETEARPEHILEFIDNICQRQVLSDAGKKLYAENMKNITQQAEQDIAAGNTPFPPPEKTTFITNA